MDNTKNLRIVFTGDTASVVAAFDAVQKKAAETKTATASLDKQISDFGASATKVGGTLTKDFTLPIVGIAAVTAKMASDFQQQMTYVRTDAGDTTDDINKLSNAVLDLAKKSQFSPDELAQGLYHLASLGLRGADALNALNVAQQMASVGGADLESTASALGAALVTGIKGVQDYSQAAGVLDATIGAGNMRMQDLVNALGTGALPVFKNAGLSITDFGAALATLTDNGMHADEAATRLRMTIALMEAPSQKAQKVLESLGISSTQLALDMQTKGLAPALEDLKKHLLDVYGTTDEGRVKMAAALTEIFGGGRSSAAAQTLIDQLDRLNGKYQQITQQSGEFGQKVAEQQQTAAFKVKAAWSSLQASAIQLGGVILPSVASAFSHIASAISSVVDWFTSLNPHVEHMILVALGVIAALGPLALAIGAIAKVVSTLSMAFSLLTNPVGLVIVGIGLLAAGAIYLYTHFENVRKTVNDTAEALKDLGEKVLRGPIQTDVRNIESSFKDATKSIKGFWDGLKDNTVIIILGQFFQQVFVPGLKAIWNTIVQDLGPALEHMWDDFKRLWDALNPGLTEALKIVGGILLGLFLAAIWAVIGAINLFIKALAFTIQVGADVIGWISNLIGWIGNLVGVWWNAWKNLIDIAWNLPRALADVVGAIGGVFGPITGIITEPFRQAYNDITGMFSSLPHALGTIVKNALGPLGPAVGGALHAAHIPGFATGGIVTSPTLAMVGEGGGPEAIIPLNNPQRASQVMQQAGLSGGGGPNITIHVNAGTVVGSNGMGELADTIYRTLQQKARANGAGGLLPNIGISPLG